MIMKVCCVARSERVNGWRLNPNITQALIKMDQIGSDLLRLAQIGSDWV